MHHINVLKDEKNRRIVPREQLFKDPDNFQFTCLINSEEGCMNTSGSHISPASSWTAENFNKSEEIDEGSTHSEEGSNKPSPLKRNSIEKKLYQAMAKPVKMHKGEKMMEKMGWQGGALGKDGHGVTTPIVPNAAYALSTIGLGHNSQLLKKPPNLRNPSPNTKSTDSKDFFTTNVLLTILDFLKNDSEIEIVFAKELFKAERKEIHDIITKIAENYYQSLHNVGTVQQGDLLAEIIKYNQFLLCTQSSGDKRDRALTLYKEAPSDMYLVTPEDLKPVEPSNKTSPTNSNDTKSLETTEENKIPNKNDDEIKKCEPNEEVKKCDKKDIDATSNLNIAATPNLKIDETPNLNIEETSNQSFDESNHLTTKNLSVNTKTKQKTEAKVTQEIPRDEIEDVPNDKPFSIRDTINEYFKEFCDDSEYKQFRFVGPFNSNEFSIINTFLNDMKMLIDNPKGIKDFDGNNIEECLSVELEMKKDHNGHIAIYKKLQKR